MKYIKVIVLCFILFLSIQRVSSAHTLIPCSPGGETFGYIVNCGKPYGHAGTPNITFQDNLLPAAYQGYVNTAVIRWNATGATNIIRHITSVNKIVTYSDANTSTVASVVNTQNINEFTFHKMSWKMSFNTAIMGSRTASLNQSTATHEFGHTIGLGDLKNSSNNNKIMYGYSTRTVTTPQTADITGAKEAVK